MVYDLIMESGEYALILRGSRMKEYAVVNGLNKSKGRVLITTLVNFLHYHKPKRWRWQLIILDCEQRVIIWDAIDLKNWQHDLKIA